MPTFSIRSIQCSSSNLSDSIRGTVHTRLGRLQAQNHSKRVLFYHSVFLPCSLTCSCAFLAVLRCVCWSLFGSFVCHRVWFVQHYCRNTEEYLKMSSVFQIPVFQISGDLGLIRVILLYCCVRHKGKCVYNMGESVSEVEDDTSESGVARLECLACS